MSEVNVKVAMPTPGEWDVEPVGGGTHWFDLWADGNLIAENIDGPANASIIKASKDMYEALKGLQKIVEEIHARWDADMKPGKLLIALMDPSLKYRADTTAIHAAIAKAEAR